MNDYFEIGKDSSGKKIVSIKCNDCQNRFEVRKQTAHKLRPYYCKLCSSRGEKNGMYGKGHLLRGEKNGNFGGLSKEHKEKISLSKIGKKINLSNELRLKKRKIGADNLKKWMNENPEKFKESSRLGGINSLKIQSDYGRVSSIERKTMEWLQQEKINYDFQHNIDNKFLYDFRVGNTLIEVNGKWFHNLPEQIIRDKEKRIYAEEKGFSVIYLWEDEVNENNFSKLEFLK